MANETVFRNGIKGNGTNLSIDDNINLTSGHIFKINGTEYLGNVDDVQQLPMSYLSTDVALGTSDVLVPSQKAVKAYADQLLATADAMIYKGVIDCTLNPLYPAANAGWTYKISVAGQIGAKKAVLTSQGVTYTAKTGGTGGNAITVTVVDTAGGGLTYTDTAGAINIDLGGTTPDIDTVVALFTGTPSTYVTVTGTGATAVTTHAVESLATGAAGKVCEVGDLALCTADNTPSGDEATVGQYWDIIQTNVDGGVTSSSTSSTNENIAVFDGVTGKIIKDGAIAKSAIVTLTGEQTLTNKTLTTPKIGTSILDVNGNELFVLTATASAVNEVTVANAATTGTPSISASGGDDNISLSLNAKGTGKVKIGTDEIVTLAAQQTLTTKTLTAPKVDKIVDVTNSKDVISFLGDADADSYLIATAKNDATTLTVGSGNASASLTLGGKVPTYATDTKTGNIILRADGSLELNAVNNSTIAAQLAVNTHTNQTGSIIGASVFIYATKNDGAGGAVAFGATERILSVGSLGDANEFSVFGNGGLKVPFIGSAGEEVVKFTYTSSAVNEITIASAATGSAPTITATGANDNIDLGLSGKGTGKVTVASALQINGASGKSALFSTASITGATTRTYTLPDKDGTFAMTSDLTSSGSTITLTGTGTETAVTITGKKAVKLDVQFYDSDNGGSFTESIIINKSTTAATTGTWTSYGTDNIGVVTTFTSFAITFAENEMKLDVTKPSGNLVVNYLITTIA